MSRPICFITGASSEIGSSTAKLAAKKGYDLILQYCSSSQLVQKLVDELKDLGVTCYLLHLDLLKSDSFIKFIDYIKKIDRPIDACVFNAAYIPDRSPFDEDMQFEQVFRINVEGNFRCVQVILPYLNKNTSFVFVGSQSAVSGGNQHCAYAMSKAAIHRMVQSLSFELAPYKRVNGVSPGVIKTARHDSDWLKNVTKEIPLKRVGESEEVAQVILWLLSDEASYVNGAIIPVTGGRV